MKKYENDPTNKGYFEIDLSKKISKKLQKELKKIASEFKEKNKTDKYSLFGQIKITERFVFKGDFFTKEEGDKLKEIIHNRIGYKENEQR